MCWLAYLATKSKFSEAWLVHSSRETNQITRTGGSDPLCWLNFENCESEPYINDATLRILLYCKFFYYTVNFLMIVVPAGKIVGQPTLSTK